MILTLVDIRKRLKKMTRREQIRCAAQTGLSPDGLRKIALGLTNKMHSETEDRLCKWFSEQDL